MDVKNKLKEIRMKEYVMDPREFADFISVNIKAYYQWESEISKPSLAKALKISLKLNKNVNDIWYL